MNKFVNKYITIFDKFKTDILISDMVKITLRRMLARRSRTILTILGVGIGIGVVYVLVSLTFGLQKLVIGNIATNETLLTLDVIPNTEVKNYLRINNELIDKFKKIENVSEARGAKSLPAEVNYKDIKSQTILYGVEPRFFALSNIHTDNGELFDKNEPSVVISSAVLSLFDLDEKEALGVNINLSFIKQSDLYQSKEATESSTLADTQVIDLPEQFKVIGIINDENNYIYLPLDYFESAQIDDFQLLKIKVSQQDYIENVRDQILSNGFIVTAMTDTLQQINNIFKVTQVVFVVIGVTALFIASIGMINTMTVSLLEQTKEIGIMKAIGATKSGIGQLFLAESILMGIGGGISGIVIGFILCQIFGVLVNILAISMGGKPVSLFYTPLWFYIVVGCFSLIIGLITGIFPAKRATKLNPLDALRYG